MSLPWCVQSSDGWCATYQGRRPSKDAFSDYTRCRRFVILRFGDARRLPDCPECLAAIKRRTS